MGDWLLDKPDVKIPASRYAGQIGDFVTAFREAGPQWAEMIRNIMLGQVDPMRQRSVDFARSLRPIGDEITAKGLDTLRTGAPPRRDESAIEPLVGQFGARAASPESDLAGIADEFLKTARSPVDDELSNYFQDRYARDVDSRLARRGLIGQGTGERLSSEAMRDFMMSEQDRADSRRIGATQAADAVRGNILNRQGQAAQTASAVQGGLTSRDLADLNARLGTTRAGIEQIGAGTGYQGSAVGGENQAWRQELADLQNVGNSFFDFYGKSVPLSKMLMDYDAQKKSQEAQLTAAGESGIDMMLRHLNSLTSSFGNVMGGMGGMGGGGSPQQAPAVPPFSYNPGGQTASYPGGGGGSYSLNAAPAGGGMTPWGTPATGYSMGEGGGYAPNAFPSATPYNLMGPGGSGINYQDPTHRPNYMNPGFIYG